MCLGGGLLPARIDNARGVVGDRRDGFLGAHHLGHRTAQRMACKDHFPLCLNLRMNPQMTNQISKY